MSKQKAIYKAIVWLSIFTALCASIGMHCWNHNWQAAAGWIVALLFAISNFLTEINEDLKAAASGTEEER